MIVYNNDNSPIRRNAKGINHNSQIEYGITSLPQSRLLNIKDNVSHTHKIKKRQDREHSY
jgi:hypothetical protein